MLNIIVSISNNNCIGGNNTLLWRQSEDLKRFKKLTENKVIIMGQRTYESLPFKPLKNRVNIVITDNKDINYDGCVMAYSIKDATEKANIHSNDNDVFIIGGGSIYEQFIPLCDRLYITRIDVNMNGDTFFPVIDDSEWKLTFEEYHDKDEKN